MPLFSFFSRIIFKGGQPGADDLVRERAMSSFRWMSRGRFAEENDDAYESKISKGRLILSLKRKNLFAWINSRLYRYRDFVIEAETGFNADNGHSALGFILRHIDDENFYYFLVSNRGYFRFDLVFNGNPISLIDWTSSHLLETLKPSIRIIARDSHFSFYLGDEWVAEVNDETIAEGRYGFAAQNFNEEDTGRFYLKHFMIESRPIEVEKLFLGWTEHIPVNPEYRVNLARSFFTRGQFTAAAVQLKKALSTRQGTAEEYALLAECLVNLRNYVPALELIEKALKLKPDLTAAAREKANLLYLLGKMKEAAEYIRSILPGFKDNPTLWNLLGNTEYSLGEWMKALEAYREAMSLAPDTPLFQVNAARCLEALEETEEAISLYLGAADLFFRQEAYDDLSFILPFLKRLGADQLEILTFEGKMLFHEGNHEKAEEILQDLADFEQCRDSSIYYLLGLILSGKEERREAQKYFQEACRLEPEYPLYRMRLAENLFLMGENAEEEVAEAYLLDPDDPWMNNLYGQLHMKRGNPEEAEGYLEKAYNLATDEADILINYSECIYLNGDTDKALDLVNKGVARSEDEHPALINQMGNLCVRKGDYQKALSSYDKAMRAAPDVPEYAKNCAAVCIELDMIMKAEELLADLEEHHPDPDVYNMFGNLALVEGEKRRAELAFQRGLELEPDNPDLKTNLASLLLGRGEMDKAKETVTEVLSQFPGKESAERLLERIREESELSLNCHNCGRVWWVPKDIPEQPALKIVGEPPGECPAGICPSCGKVYCIQCARNHLRKKRFVCPDCDAYLKLADDNLKYLVSRYIGNS